MANCKPTIYKNIFEEDYFNNLKKYLSDYKFDKNEIPDHYGSYRIHSFDGDVVLKDAELKLVDFARKIFENNEIIPSYCTYVRYKGNTPVLEKHKDEGPTSYLLDVCLGYNTQWPLIIENKEFLINENEGLGFCPTSQLHWRPNFPDSENNVVEMLMFGFVMPDHLWWKIKENERVGMIKRFLKTPSLKNKVSD